MKFRLKIPIIEGTERPRGYLIGAWDPFGCVAYAYPAPIALAVRFWHNFSQRLLAFSPSRYDLALSDAFESGYNAGQVDAANGNGGLMDSLELR